MLNKPPLSLRVYPDPALAQKCEEVAIFDEDFEVFCGQLMAAMREFKGIGLAANQVGELKRVFAMAGEVLGLEHDIVVVNPQLVAASGDADAEEGCLSLPGVRYAVAGRRDRITVRSLDAKGAVHVMELQGLPALCVQHEMDHLDGMTMLDRLSPLKAARARSKLGKGKGKAAGSA